MGVDKLISRTLFIISIIFKRLLLSHNLMQPMHFFTIFLGFFVYSQGIGADIFF